MNILILGGNGFIGFNCAQKCIRQGHNVACIGRDIKSAARRLPHANWISVDLAELQTAESWHQYLVEIDAVINCAGVLQQSPRDDINAVQHYALIALYNAAGSSNQIHIVQISANLMAEQQAGSTKFLTTKATADEALVNSGLNYTILRPALVMGRNAHGGTALLRAASAFPIILPVPFPNKECHTTDLSTLTAIALAGIEGEYGKSGDYSVASPQAITFKDLSITLRNWLGLPAAQVFKTPETLLSVGSVLADISAWLGWRSPMRSTAIKIMQAGVLVDESKPLIETCSAYETLQKNDAGVQDLWFSRLYLLKPVMIGVLALFWLVSGMIALFQLDAAAQYLNHLNISAITLNLLLIITALLDCALGIAVLFRRTARYALLGMCALSLAYLTGASLFAPVLWLDPIGPLLKVVPSIFLSLTTLAILDER